LEKIKNELANRLDASNDGHNKVTETDAQAVSNLLWYVKFDMLSICGIVSLFSLTASHFMNLSFITGRLPH
jgi:hypothetical protein